MSSDDIKIPQAGAAQYWGTHEFGWIAEDGVLNAQDHTTFHLFLDTATDTRDDTATDSA